MKAATKNKVQCDANNLANPIEPDYPINAAGFRNALDRNGAIRTGSNPLVPAVSCLSFFAPASAVTQGDAQRTSTAPLVDDSTFCVTQYVIP
jgi:hypothetical protein